jgi:hypothetical protein
MSKESRQFVWGCINFLIHLILVGVAVVFLSRNLSNFGAWILLIGSYGSIYQTYTRYIKPNL